MPAADFLGSTDVADVFKGAPIALQLVGKHSHDEETVAATDLVSRIIQDQESPRVPKVEKLAPRAMIDKYMSRVLCRRQGFYSSR